MADKQYKECTNCVMDTTDSKITFDDHGVCDHCRTFYKDIQPFWAPDSKESLKQIEAVADKIRQAGKNKEFDCIIGMSGGVDSSYLTYLAKERLNLRPLVFHVDAGWNSQEAVNNIEKIVDKLKLDLYTVVINWEEMKDLQLSFIKAGVPHIDTPQDYAFFATMYRFAEKYKVKHILTGANYSTECVRNPIEWMYYQSDSTQLKNIHSKFGTKPLKKFAMTSILRHKIYLSYIKKIKVIRPLNYFHYVRDEAIKFMSETFGYQSYGQKHFESRFTTFYEGYWLPVKFGFDPRKVQFSSLILTGQMSREEAIERLKKPVLDEIKVKNEFEFVANKLGVSIEELKGFFNAPNKSYKDYKNQEYLYHSGAYVMRALGLERGGKR